MFVLGTLGCGVEDLQGLAAESGDVSRMEAKLVDLRRQIAEQRQEATVLKVRIKVAKLDIRLSRFPSARNYGADGPLDPAGLQSGVAEVQARLSHFVEKIDALIEAEVNRQ